MLQCFNSTIKVGDNEMGKLIITIISCIIVVGMTFYLKKRLKNKTPMGLCLRNGILFNMISIIGYVFHLLAGNTIVGNIGYIVMSISIDWMLCCIFAYVVEYTSMRKQFAKIKYVIYVFVGIDNILLLIGQKGFHIILCNAFFIGMAIILIRKKQLAPAIYVRKYMVVLIALFIVVGIDLFAVINSSAIDFSVQISAILLLFLYYLTFEYKQNDFVQRMQMLIVEDIKSPIVYFDYEQVIANFNQNADKLFGFSNRYDVSILNYNLEDFLKENDFYFVKELKKDYIFEWMKNNIYYKVEYRCLFDRSNDDKQVGTIISFNDITEQKRSAREMEYMITHDYLTGLYNRNFIRMNQAKIVDKNKYPISIVIFDVKGARMINDFYGEDKGDEIMIGVAEMMQKNIKSSYIPVRLDGDEFMIIMPKVKTDDAIPIIETISKDIEKNVAPNLGIYVVYAIDFVLNEEDTLENCMKRTKKILYQQNRHMYEE